MFKGNKAKIHHVLFSGSSNVAYLRYVLLDIYTIFQYSNKDILDRMLCNKLSIYCVLVLERDKAHE